MLFRGKVHMDADNREGLRLGEEERQAQPAGYKTQRVAASSARSKQLVPGHLTYPRVQRGEIRIKVTFLLPFQFINKCSFIKST